ncbi:aspartate/glutamate racemase family protein [Sphaerochaeta sp. PS]|uniref:aspartate/glutamate racemase family protein n=1 Tax=Sphaerochaeta sp. PS TaxID=3076336 RepID=UPI0028A45A58|nr:aspartate/glutamate racemase family protein [Sphaerochaeta sp. PS]MDT4762992.1 aspartate/glutamate racemase family protein [Sphaerochaeta sp. PS]
MKRIVLIHTVKSVYETFEKDLRAAVGDVKIYNMLDEFLAADPAERGIFSIENRMRLMHDLQSAQLTGADLIVVTCSTLTPHVVAARPFFTTPIIAIDDAMCALAVQQGERIAVLATAESTVNPTLKKLEEEASLQKKTIKLSSLCCPEAIVQLKAGHKAKHDKLVLDMAREIKDADTIILAQASMAHMQDVVQAQTRIRTLSSPQLCIQDVARKLGIAHFN